MTLQHNFVYQQLEQYNSQIGNLDAVFPIVQSVRLRVRTGRTAVSERVPGTEGYLGVRPDDCPGRRAILASVRTIARDGGLSWRPSGRLPGTEGYLGVRPDDCPGRRAILASVRTIARDGRAGTAGVSDGATCRVTPDDG